MAGWHAAYALRALSKGAVFLARLAMRGFGQHLERAFALRVLPPARRGGRMSLTPRQPSSATDSTALQRRKRIPVERIASNQTIAHIHVMNRTGAVRLRIDHGSAASGEDCPSDITRPLAPSSQNVYKVRCRRGKGACAVVLVAT